MRSVMIVPLHKMQGATGIVAVLLGYGMGFCSWELVMSGRRYGTRCLVNWRLLYAVACRALRELLATV